MAECRKPYRSIGLTTRPLLPTFLFVAKGDHALSLSRAEYAVLHQSPVAIHF
jgi:hypothetical protein